MSTVPDESLPGYQRVSLVVECLSSLIEKSEKLKSIFDAGARSGSKSYSIKIMDTDEDFFKGCFVRSKALKSQKSGDDPDTLKVDNGEEETFLVGHNREHAGFARDFSGATTGTAVTSNGPVTSAIAVSPTGTVTPVK